MFSPDRAHQVSEIVDMSSRVRIRCAIVLRQANAALARAQQALKRSEGARERRARARSGPVCVDVDARPSAPTKRILIVDSDDRTRQLWREALLHDEGLVLEASDGREALTKVFDDVPSLVVTELCLPFVDGLSLCEILRRDPTTARVPILIVTTETRPVELDRVRHYADAVLTKPVPPEIMVTEVRRLITPSSDGKRPSPGRPNAVARVDNTKDRFTTSRAGRRPVLANSFARFRTTRPRVPPPDLICPSCDRPLKYEHSHIGGVSARHPEQWDYYVCSTSCGSFQYRQRTRKLRRVSTVPSAAALDQGVATTRS